MNSLLAGINRAQLIRWTAVYLLIYALINACGGIVFGILGGLAAGLGAATAATVGSSSADAAAASSTLVAAGGLSLGMAVLFLISVPVFGVAAWGLFQRKRWARNAAVIALGFSVLLSLLNLNNGIGGVIWILISGFGIYLFWSDEGIKQELSR